MYITMVAEMSGKDNLLKKKSDTKIVYIYNTEVLTKEAFDSQSSSSGWYVFLGFSNFIFFFYFLIC